MRWVLLVVLVGIAIVPLEMAGATSSVFRNELEYLGDGMVYADGWESVGVHTGADNATDLVDSGASWVVDGLIGYVVDNETDGSSATITDNDGTTVTGTLAGGSENDWDNGEVYRIYDPAGETGYGGARSSEGEEVAYGRNYLRVGQQLVSANSVDTYTIWRGMLYFDTSDIPEGADISAASITLYVKEDSSDVDYEMVIVDGQDLVLPPVEEVYGDLLGASTSWSDALDTADILAVDQACVFALNSYGVGGILPGGVSRFAVRSSEDVGNSAPAGDEFVDFWASDVGGDLGRVGCVLPRLSVEYVLGDLGEPEEKSIEGLWVFSNYLETGDVLFVFRYKMVYPGVSGEDAGDFYEVQLLDDDGEIIYKGYLPGWDYRPGSVYLEPGSGIEWGGGVLDHEYTVRIVGDEDVFATPPFVEETTDYSSWKGSDLSVLDRWVLYESVPDIESYYTQTTGSEVDLVVTPYDSPKLNAVGAAMFLEGIPELDSVRPDLFSFVESDLGYVSDTTEVEDLGEWDRLGTSFTETFEDVGVIVFGLESPTGEEAENAGKAVAAMCFGGMALMVIGAVVLKTGNPSAGAISALPIVIFGAAVGVYPMVLLAMAGVLGLVVLWHQLWLKST
jgi:hypothetical protein